MFDFQSVTQVFTFSGGQDVYIIYWWLPNIHETFSSHGRA